MAKKDAETKKKAVVVDIEKLKPQTIKVGEQSLIAMPKHFMNGAGSKGYHASGKIMIDGLMCQANIILSIIGTKPEEKKK